MFARIFTKGAPTKFWREQGGDIRADSSRHIHASGVTRQLDAATAKFRWHIAPLFDAQFTGSDILYYEVSMASPSPAAAVAAELTPVAPQERVQLFDVLRGFCLFGVLWSNLNDWYTVAEPVTTLDHALRWTQDWLVESRFYSMLGFLFGIGFAMQLTRAAQRGQDVRNLFLRRMSVLLGFGIIHATLIWHGDILADYALAGFALVLFRRLSSRKLLIALPVLWLLYPYLVVHLAPLLNIHLPNYGSAWQQLNQQALQAYAHGTWARAVAAGSRQFFGSLVRSLVLGGSASFLGLFILGLWAVRVDMITRLTRRRAYIVWASLGALMCWAGLQYVHLNLGHWWPAPRVSSVATWRELRFWWPPRGIVIHFIDESTTWTNAAVYALPFALAMSFSAVANRLQPLAALGRMTLTTYLVQSSACTTLFYNWGFGFMNRINLSGILIFTLVLFSVQVAFSIWWLKRYRFGPAEWLWRSLAYGRKMPVRVAEISSASVEPTQPGMA